MTDQIGTPTGWVIATPDADGAQALWRDALGLSEEHQAALELPAWQHPTSPVRVTIAEFAEPDPPIALAVRCDDLDASYAAATATGLSEYWRDSSGEGTRFIMCQGDSGVFFLLYQRQE